MKSHCTNYLLAIASVVCLSFAATAQAEDAGYVPPRFMSAGNAGSPGMQRQASPLAGGPAAAYGDQFMDAQGNPIIMPASYCQSCPGPAGGYCPSCPGDFGAAGGYGDPMAVDFGGYGNDQCGPHYFDIAVDSIFLKPNEALDGVGPLISVGAGQNFIDPASGTAEYEPGWRIAARYDLGPLSVFEGTYMGLYDIGFTNQIRSVDATVAAGLPSQDFQLFTVFSNFGIPTPIDGLDDGSVYTLGYQSDIQSTELSYRRYWTGFNTRVTGTLLLGARYLRMTEDFTFNAVAFAGDSSLRVVEELHLDGGAVAGQGLVNRVVDDLGHQMVQAALPRRADVHARAFAHRLQAFENRDLIRVVRPGYRGITLVEQLTELLFRFFDGHRVFSHAQSPSQKNRRRKPDAKATPRSY